LLTGSGCAKNVVCPVHNWTYDLNGRQIAAPHFHENPCLDLERTSLTDWNGLLFSGPRNIHHDLAPLASWTELSAENYVLERVDEEEHDLNWKVFLEIYLEDYHIGVVHPGFRAFVDAADVRGAFQAVGGERFFCEQVNVRTRTRLRSEYYLDRQIADTRRDYVEVGLAVLDEVTREDHIAAEKLQSGRQALYNRGDDAQGPYQLPMEQGLRRFHDCLRKLANE
jgi:phenylpropionate dioxygenase-like ring-hydroxylating dioxygenase large terminal subunit